MKTIFKPKKFDSDYHGEKISESEKGRRAGMAMEGKIWIRDLIIF